MACRASVRSRAPEAGRGQASQAATHPGCDLAVHVAAALGWRNRGAYRAPCADRHRSSARDDGNVVLSAGSPSAPMRSPTIPGRTSASRSGAPNRRGNCAAPYARIWATGAACKGCICAPAFRKRRCASRYGISGFRGCSKEMRRAATAWSNTYDNPDARREYRDAVRKITA